jgi:hypothetical protein
MAKLVANEGTGIRVEIAGETQVFLMAANISLRQTNN